MNTLSRWAVAAAAVAYAAAVLGSWVRINGAGMSCPDWPLCHGQWVPQMQGGMILEWSHRLLVLVESALVLGTFIVGWVQRRRLGAVLWFLVAAGALYGIQVALGAATVWLGNSPQSVALHWGTAMLFLAALSGIGVLASEAGQHAGGGDSHDPRVLLVVATTLAFLTTFAGAYVSSSGAGLACGSFPGCGTVSGAASAVAAQMTHRIFAFLTLACVLGICLVVRRAAAHIRAVFWIAAALVVVQFGLGIANVALRLPVGLREAHAANAAAVFLALFVATTLSVRPRPSPTAA